MCINLIANRECKIRKPTPTGHRYANQSMQIRREFDRLYQASTIEKPKLGVGCAGYTCCFSNSKYVTIDQCPYYDIQLS